MTLIDAHAHIVLKGTTGAAGPVCGPEIGYSDGVPWYRIGDWKLHGVDYENSPFMQSDLRLAAMDEAGITAQLLSPNPLTYFHHIAPSDATNYCRRHNEELATIVAEHPDRFAGFASVPMQDPDAAVAELERSVNDLGMLGAYIGSDPGRHLDDPAYDEFYAACVELDVPLSIHPAPTGLDGPQRDDRITKFDLELVVEFSYEEMMSVALLIFGGVLQRHPGLDVCISHGGGSTPFHLAKLRKLAERRPSMPEWIKEPGAFDAEIAKLWFDIHVTGEAERAFAVQQLGTEHLVFGTNFSGWDGGSTDGIEDLASTLNTNAIELFRLDRRAPGLLDS